MFGPDLRDEYAFHQGLKPATRTASANGSGIAMGTDGPEFFGRLSVGDVSGTDPTLDVKFQESDDNSTFTDIPGASFTQVTASDAAEEILVRNRTKAYARAVATIAGTSPSFAFAVDVISKRRFY